MVTQAQALAAKVALRVRLDRPSWLRGIGISREGENFFIKVNVDRITPEVRAIIPEEIGGVQIRIEPVGEIEAL
jgi:hypothetical protein